MIDSSLPGSRRLTIESMTLGRKTGEEGMIETGMAITHCHIGEEQHKGFEKENVLLLRATIVKVRRRMVPMSVHRLYRPLFRQVITGAIDTRELLKLVV